MFDFCKKCGFRLHTELGEHVCQWQTPVDDAALWLVRTTAGNILSNLLFLRLQPDVMLGALASSLGYMLAHEVDPNKQDKKYDSLMTTVRDLMHKESEKYRIGQPSLLARDSPPVKSPTKKKLTIPKKRKRP